MKIIIFSLGKIFIFISRIFNYFIKSTYKYKFERCGKNVYIGKHCIFTESNIVVGNDIYIGPYCIFQSTNSKIIINNHVMFGPGVNIHGGNHIINKIGSYMKSVEKKADFIDKDVVIEDDVWVGANAIILSGVTIGEGSVIGAGSIITKDVPPFTIIVGNPVRKSFPRWTEEQIKKHRKIINEKKNDR